MILTCTAEGVQHRLLATLTDPLHTSVVDTNPLMAIVTAAIATDDHCHHLEVLLTIEDLLHHLNIRHQELVLITAGGPHLPDPWEIASMNPNEFLNLYFFLN